MNHVPESSSRTAAGWRGSQGGLRPGFPHLRSEIGNAVHRVIHQLLVEGERGPALDLVAKTVARDRCARLPHVYGLAAKQKVVSCATRYFENFAPEPDWVYLGAETPLIGSRMDLLFERPNGRLRGDEIKSGLFASLGDPTPSMEHANRQAREARHLYGQRFSGVRLVILSGTPRATLISGCRAAAEETPTCR